MTASAGVDTTVGRDNTRIDLDGPLRSKTPGNAKLLSGSRGRSRVCGLGRVTTRPARLDDVDALKGASMICRRSH